MKWIVFCSQTGKEIRSLSNILGKVPDVLVTNRSERLQIRDWLENRSIEVKEIPDKPKESDYLFLDNYDDFLLITLHGYLRIIPKEVIFKHNHIYNGHPGLISHYPDLKGLDPQEKAFNKKYREIGSVVHKVDVGVDSGEIITSYSINNLHESSSLDDYFNILSYCSLQSWITFFNNKLYTE